jgi:hypothetical protein
VPFKSKAQERFAYSKEGTRALGGKSKVAEWQSVTNQNALPERVTPKKKGALGSR